MMKSMVVVLLGIGMLTAAGSAIAEDPMMALVEDDPLSPPPDDFPRFEFGDHEEDALWLSRFLWYHFSNRLGFMRTLFNQEYVTVSDMWMGGAEHPNFPGRRAQDLHREQLTGIQLSDNGYVWVHQHFSHAHEQGWPFPMWYQSPAGPEGLSAGWHFQEESGPGWTWAFYLDNVPDSPFARERAIEGWELEDVESEGIVDDRWRLTATGSTPAITTPDTVSIVAFNSPFLQLRWNRDPEPAADAPLPYIEWLREGDTDFGSDRRVYIMPGTGNPEYEGVTGTTHSQVRMYTHPKWDGRITRIRIVLDPRAEEGHQFDIDSFFTVYDNRKPVNNAIYILASWEYYRWTGDLEFLRSMIQKLRMAMRYAQSELGGLEHNHIRVPYVGHDGLSGIVWEDDGSKTIRYGHGIGNNYWDLLPFGWDDMYATMQYYKVLHVMADIEEAIREHPEWDMPLGSLALDPEELRAHAADVKQTSNEKFWNEETGRFYGSFDVKGRPYDYGFTFLNLETIWYGIAEEERAQSIMDWITGRRIVEGDTSTGDDIYRWRFGPRATTRRNIEWYGHGWTNPEDLDWGGQVQDGGAVLGFTFYDLWARIHVEGPDSAWERLGEILEWERDVWAVGGYRAFYADGGQGTTLQGGGTAGGLGIDYEFFESSLVPTIIVQGFLGIQPTAYSLSIRPQLPEACPEMGMTRLRYRGVEMDVHATPETLTVTLHDAPLDPIAVDLGPEWRLAGDTDTPGVFHLDAAQTYRFERID